MSLVAAYVTDSEQEKDQLVDIGPVTKKGKASKKRKQTVKPAFDFFENYQLLLDYGDQHDNYNVPENYSWVSDQNVECHLGQWLLGQRKKLQQRRMSQDHYDMFNQLVMTGKLWETEPINIAEKKSTPLVDAPTVVTEDKDSLKERSEASRDNYFGWDSDSDTNEENLRLIPAEKIEEKETVIDGEDQVMLSRTSAFRDLIMLAEVATTVDLLPTVMGKQCTVLNYVRDRRIVSIPFEKEEVDAIASDAKEMSPSPKRQHYSSDELNSMSVADYWNAAELSQMCECPASSLSFKPNSVDTQSVQEDFVSVSKPRIKRIE